MRTCSPVSAFPTLFPILGAVAPFLGAGAGAGAGDPNPKKLANDDILILYPQKM